MAEQISLLRTVGRILAGPGYPVDKLQRICAKVSSAAEGAAAVGLTVVGGSGVDWTAASPPVSGLSWMGAGKLGYAEDNGTLVSLAAAEGTLAIANDTAGKEAQLIGRFAGDGVRSAAAVPLAADASISGVLLVASPFPDAFPPQKAALLTGLAGMLGMFLKALKLERELEAGLRGKDQRLEAFQTAAARFALEESPDEALREFVDSARKLAGAKYGGIVFWDQQGRVQHSVSVGFPEEDEEAMGQLRLTELLGLIRYALVQEKKTTVRVADSTFLPNKADSEIPLLRSLLGVPFTGKDGSHGAFFLAEKEGMPRFTRDDEKLLQTFSAMAAVLLDNIRLYEALDRERRTLSGIQMSMTEGLMVLDQEGLVAFSNRAIQGLLGADLAQLQGLRLSDVLRQSNSCFETPDVVLELADVLDIPPETPSTFEVGQLRPNRCDVSIAVFPIVLSPAERLTGLLLRNVTDERDLQRRRDSFVSVASHELRTPMTTVIGFTELLLRRESTPEQRKAWLEHVYDDSQRVVRIVDDLLNVSRIQSGKLPVELREVDVRDLIADAVESMKQATDIHETVVAVGPDLPLAVADADKVTQVLINLLSNAIKYSPSGGRITVSAHHDTANARLVIAVTDEGIGIAQEHQQSLFTTFQRLDREETRSIRGTGLGLYVVKSLAEMMHGSVWVESELDKGSTFYFSLPLAPV
ncbi:MAG: ATP-binding protein [Dehalococcoidia bacterium]